VLVYKQLDVLVCKQLIGLLRNQPWWPCHAANCKLLLNNTQDVLHYKLVNNGIRARRAALQAGQQWNPGKTCCTTSWSTMESGQDVLHYKLVNNAIRAVSTQATRVVLVTKLLPPAAGGGADRTEESSPARS
jgi:hypothetical protein